MEELKQRQYTHNFKNKMQMKLKYPSPLKAYTGPTGPTGGPSRAVEETCEEIIGFNRPVFALEKHMSVIKKGPTMPLTLEMFAYTEERADEAGMIGDSTAVLETTFTGEQMQQSSNYCKVEPCMVSMMPNSKGTASDFSDISAFYNSNKELKGIGDEIILPIDYIADEFDIFPNDKLEITHEWLDPFNNTKRVVCTVEILTRQQAGYAEYYWTNPTPPAVPVLQLNMNNPNGGYFREISGFNNSIVCTIVGIVGAPPPIYAITNQDLYTVTTIQKKPFFEFKFPKFSYRYKYLDGEYSVFAPWSELAFIPSEFDYAPKKGYNLGMVNQIRSIKIKNWRPKNIPKDVIEIDILYKESNSPNIYTVESFTKNDPEWDAHSGIDTIHTSHFGEYQVTSELIHKVVESNQLLRPWDNVPRMALGQEITANRLIYANYLEGYKVLDNDNTIIKPIFQPVIESLDFSIDAGDDADPREPVKSLKSMRTYQLGVVYRDRYGRETPVLTSQSGSISIDPDKARFKNKLSVALDSNPPYWAESYTFYIKETSNEYYNLAMDRWYDAEDGGVWLSFPSSERNKIMTGDEDSGQGSTRSSFLILKKQHDSDIPTDQGIKYKITSVKNNAPDFIKSDNHYWGSIPMMLPPAGWGINGKVGDWNSGMFATTGLPLPERLYLDIYAEYWDQSVLHALTNDVDAQIRITQSAGQGSAYTSATADQNNKTRWYDVSSITYVGSPQQTYTETVEQGDSTIEMEVEFPSQPEQLIRITLKNAFGVDAAFCQPLPDDNLALNRGLSLEARTKVFKNRAEFEGRFFVKINRDWNIEQNLVKPQKVISETMQVLQSKHVRYICAAHPGMQDWNDNTVGWAQGAATVDASGNSIVFGTGAGAYIAPTILVEDDSTTVVGSGPDDYPGQPKEISSLSFHHANKGADYINSSGAPVGYPQTGDKWPYGPGQDSDGVFNSGFWFGKYEDMGFLNQSGGFYTMPQSQTAASDWPSVTIDQWGPFSCNVCNTGYTLNGTTVGSWVGEVSVGLRTQPQFTAGGNGYYEDVANGSQGFPATPNTATSNPGADSMTGVLNLASVDTDDIADHWERDGYTFPANPYQYHAIWGNPGDLVATIFDDGSSAGGLGDGQGPTGGLPVWDASTIYKLREDWYYLYYGAEKVDASWPRATQSSARWFIDKCGAAEGYSGNGIWDNGEVGYMDLSFYGIGSVNHHHRDFSLVEHQEGELGFANAMSTTGTQFRFKQDPDQIVYTITNVKLSTKVLNYEGFYGGWGHEDSNGGISGGAGIGRHKRPPWGSDNPGPSSLADRLAFISDLFNKSRSLNGSAPWNYRLRMTITLDKIIGIEGASSFHPITNHVDEDGKANIRGGRKEYSENFGSTGHITARKGGTTPGLEFYNLHSYWNATAQPTSSQSSDKDTCVNLGQHIGLHERGLNETTIEIVTQYKGEEDDAIPMSENPAIWETEPMEDIGLDIYYAASPTYPINIERHRSDASMPDPLDTLLDGSPTYAHEYDYSYRGEEIIPKGSRAILINSSNPLAITNTNVVKVCGVQGNLIFLDNPVSQDVANEGLQVEVGDKILFLWDGNGRWYGAENDVNSLELIVSQGLDTITFKIQPNTHNIRHSLTYFNCYSFNNGVESNRIRDDYNAVIIDKGVKASMPLAEQYTEERKSSSLIFSGIYNSTSGINRTNQFIQAEPITKDLNPINGSIQKLFARDTDLITFCENKVFKILAKKDALFNADGNTNVTSNAAVLGQTIPFSGEYGMSKNPESFAQDSYRLYFSDKTRGAILRLSKDGLTPISNYGMKDWFKDNLKNASSVFGSFDDREDQYNITIETMDYTRNEADVFSAYTLSFVEKSRGWVSFKSFITQGGISHNNTYYTFPNNNFSLQSSQDPWGVNYEVEDYRRAEVWAHNVDLRVKRLISNAQPSSSINTVLLDPGPELLEGMTVEGWNGVKIDTEINIMNNIDDSMTLSKSVRLNQGEQLSFKIPRNNFYGIDHYSMIKVLYNSDQNTTIKRFKTLDYEGTQARINDNSGGPLLNLHDSYANTSVSYNQEYYDNYEKLGWFVKRIKTDSQEGTIKEFINKENKWFNYIKGQPNAGDGESVDTGEFTLQGLGTGGTTS